MLGSNGDRSVTVIGMFAVALAQLNLWSQMPVEAVAFMLLALLINLVAFAYLVYRYARGYPSARLE
ncbi:MAG: hypothetical protein HY741_12990 [Chloroflexi bacterium]|nr:hypothetical protein [Chloroflexota bacterium]